MPRRGRIGSIALATALAAGILVIAPTSVQGDDDTTDAAPPVDLDGFVEHDVAGEFGTSDELLPPGIVQHIVGGTDAKPGEFPWASFLVIETNQGISTCGGSVIANRWILTAAHCVDGAISVRAAVGKTNRPLSLSSPRWKSAKNVFIHSGYDPSKFGRNDTALIKLRKSISGIQPLPIAKPSETDLYTPGRRTTVAGWGIMHKDATSIPVDLQKASIPIVKPSKCANIYGAGYMKSQNMCAGFNASEASGPHGACSGDSGSALIAYSKNGPVQIGIVSYGVGKCTSLEFPGAYMRADVYRNDIKQLLGGSLPAPPKPPKCNGKRATIAGTVGDDILIGTAQRDIIVSRAGDDTVKGLRGNDLICLGPDHDMARGGSGDDRVFGGSGIDTIRGDDGHDTIIGEGGNDTLDGNAGRDRINGGSGVDIITGGTSGDVLRGGTDADMVWGDDGHDTLIGNAGNDNLYGGSGPDTLNGNADQDNLFGGPGNDALDGGTDIDHCAGGSGSDTATMCETIISIP